MKCKVCELVKSGEKVPAVGICAFFPLEHDVDEKGRTLLASWPRGFTAEQMRAIEDAKNAEHWELGQRIQEAAT